MILAAVALALAVVAPSAADVTGRWEGQISLQRSDGTTAEDGVLLILSQKDATITGTVGNDDADRHPIVKGSIEGGRVTLHARNAQNDREYLIELTLSGEEMTGSVTSGERKGQVAVKRSKPAK